MKKHYFISDLHLGAAYITDKRAHEAKVISFLNVIKRDAASLYLLGDILDYWFEYHNVVPQGHIRFLGKLAELADAGIKIYWMVGNHDVWLRHYLEKEIGLTVFHGHTTVNIEGTELFISHGDDVGRRSPMFRFTRWCFHNKFCQLCYAAIHPRWTTQIATGFSNHNRVTRSEADELKEIEIAAKDLYEFSHEYALTHPDVKHYVYGHLHLARQLGTGTGALITHLGDWIRQFTYAVFDGQSMTLHKWNGTAIE